MSSKHPEVFIVVLAYNCCDKVRRCLTSLARLDYNSFKIIVVDNGSTDEVANVVQEEFSGIPFIQTGDNWGYTGGNNQGIRYALSQGADYILVLNPDTVVANPSFLTDLVTYNEHNPDVGISGPRIFFQTDGHVQNTVLYAPSFWRNAANWLRYRLFPENFQLSKDKVLDAEVLNGVCVLLRADCLKEVGLFDENMFMYIEDTDLDHRARQFGWSVRYLPVDGVIHEQKTAGYHMTSQVSFLLRRNSVYYLCKIGKRLDAWAYAICSLLIMVTRAVVTFRWRAFKDYLRFCERLAQSYCQVLFMRRFDSSFGPPYL